MLDQVSLTPVLCLVLCLLSRGYGREIVFPSIAAIERYQRHGSGHVDQTPLSLSNPADDDEGISLETDAMGGLTSFAHLPYVPCFSPMTDEEIESYDIAVLGAPFDTVGLFHQSSLA